MLLNYSNNMSLFKNFKYEILHLWWTRSGEVGSLEMVCWPMRGGGVLTPPDPPVDPPLEEGSANDFSVPILKPMVELYILECHGYYFMHKRPNWALKGRGTEGTWLSQPWYHLQPCRRRLLYDHALWHVPDLEGSWYLPMNGCMVEVLRR